jgi:O-antigen/teichoic acid export membrane protein
MDLDKKTYFYVMLTRIINSGGGLLSLFLITHFMSKVETGLYYTFLSLIGFQVFFEIGLSTIIVQRTTQFMHKLSWKKNNLFGDHILLSNYFKQSFLIILCLTIIMMIFLSIIGDDIISKSVNLQNKSSLLVAWFFCIIFTGCNMVIAFLFNFLEGLGKVRDVAKIRFWQCTLALTALWTALFFGKSVSSLGLQFFISAFVAGLLIFYYFKNILYLLWQSGSSSNLIKRINYEWPFQWRLTISFLGTYFGNQIFVAMSSFAGNFELAGKIGIALQILTSITGFSATPVTSRFPIFGILIGKGEHLKFKDMFIRAINFSYLLLFFFVVITWLSIAAANYFSILDFNKFISVGSAILLTISLIANHIVVSLNVNIQSRGRDDFFVIAIMKIILVGLAVVFLNGNINETNVILTYFLSSLISLFIASIIYTKGMHQF